MSDDKRSTRRNVLKGASSASVALLGTGVASADNPNQSSEDTEAQFVQESSNKPILEHILEHHGAFDKITLVTFKPDENRNISKSSESTIDLSNVDSLRQARNNKAIIEKIPSQLRNNINQTEQKTSETSTTTNDTNIEPNSSIISKEENHSFGRKNDDWIYQLTLFSNWSYDFDKRVLEDEPYSFGIGYSTNSNWEWKGLKNSELTGVGTSTGNQRIEGKFKQNFYNSDYPYVENEFDIGPNDTDVTNYGGFWK